MKIVILGAGGQVGSVLAQEALDRGHHVIGVTRRSTPESLSHPNATHMMGDAYDPHFLAPLIEEADVVVNATRPIDGHEDELVNGSLEIQRVCRESRTLLVVSGGAGSLPVSDALDAVRTISTHYVQDAWRAIAEASVKQYDTLIAAWPEGNWVYIAPPAYLFDGPRKGNVRKSSTSLVVDSQGESALTWIDFCDLILSEIEKPSGYQRITGGY